MEYLVGQDLAQVAATGQVAIADAIRWVMQACGALAEAHAAGIVHRDLKPANLFLTAASGGEAAVKVLDFGISKVAAPAAADSADGATATGTSIGSPLYMSPEQIRAHKNVDPRSDIWSLGVILYQLTTGRAPFRGPGLPALAVAIAVDPPPRPSSLRDDLPPKLERIILRCLAKSPDDRYPHVMDLMAALASRDHGMLGFAIDPDFYTNGYIYYTPTAEQLRNSGGAQEDSDCLVAPEWEQLFHAKVAEVLKKL
jgi:serine/threonine-protein kinase